MAHFDEQSVIVYQAYCPQIANYAIKHGRFGDGFSFSRMSWIKPNFLWMMFRCGWGTKENQEITLGLRIRRAFFDQILFKTVPSTWDRSLHATEDDWSKAVERSNVRLQWDPDHNPSGAKIERRAIQIGLRGEELLAFGTTELLEVIDMSGFVAEQRDNAAAQKRAQLLMPVERVYKPSAAIAKHLGLNE